MSLPHWVLSCNPSWSHFRSLCALAARIVSFRPVTVTILVSDVPGLVERVIAEVRRCSYEETDRESCGDIIRILALPVGEADPDDAFRRAWQALNEELPIARGLESKLSAAAPRPSLAILDGFQLSWLQIIRSAELAPPVLQWMMAFSGGFVRICGPADMGGRGDTLRALQGGLSIADPCGEVVHVPGLPPMYDWEFFPQDIGAKEEAVLAAEARAARFAEDADGLLTNCTVAYDGRECLDSISQWIARRRGRKTFHLGPMIPLEYGTHRFSRSAIQAELASIPSPEGAQVLSFLDQTLEDYGPRSVVYISFGTEHWPRSLNQIHILLTALKRRHVPFLFTYASTGAKIADEIRVEFDDAGLFVRYGPQQTILAHQACGWFLTHGGMNSSMEALSQGIPLIGWPFAADQPANIAYLTQILDVAFELVEVRTGSHGLKPPYHSGRKLFGTAAALEKELAILLEAMMGEDGKRKRANAERIRAEIAQSWLKDDGTTRKEFERFLDFWLTV